VKIIGKSGRLFYSYSYFMKEDGITLVPWSQGKCLIWDFTCVDTFAASYVENTKLSSASAADSKEALRMKHYEVLMRDYNFVPVAVETVGSFGSKAKGLVNSLGRRIAEVTGEPNSRSYLLERISIALQRGKSSSILGTIPSTHALDEFFYI